MNDQIIVDEPHPPALTMRLGKNVWLHGDAQSRAAFFAALAAAQGEYAPIARSRTVKVRSDKGDYTFDYAPLEEVLSATRPALNKHGIAWVSTIAEGESSPELHTMLTHASGAFIHAIELLPAVDKPQVMGSALTYHRRYGYQCLTGTSPEYDDDGNEASGNKVEQVQQRRREPPPAAKPAPKAEQKPAPQPERAAAPKPAPEPAPAPKAAPEPASAARAPSVPPEPAEPAPVAPAPTVTVGGEPEEPGPGDQPYSSEQRDEIIRLAIAAKLSRPALQEIVTDRIGPGKNSSNLTVTDANVLITLLKGRVQG